MDNEQDDDVPHLSAETFAVLQEFYKEQEERELLLSKVETNEHLEENWQLSQFWYDNETIDALSEIALKTVGLDGKIALISCPSVYKTLKTKLGAEGTVHLYEFDKRFSTYGDDFYFYDYNSPLQIPRDKSGYYDLIIADPPFLSDECLTKTAVTIKFLCRKKILLCTGAVMANMAEKLLGLKKNSFEPKHKRNLGNEFWCFSNYDLNSMD